MTAAERYRLALAMAENHADRCAVCESPSLDRGVRGNPRDGKTGCSRGRLLDQQWIGHWRRRVDALTERRR